jgi:polar amino acid transport system substrate-binding protein
MYLDANGTPTGILPDLARVLANDLGVELELVDLDWADHMPALLEGRVDLLLSFGNTPARALSVEFAHPLLPHEVLVLVRDEGSIRTERDVHRPGTPIAAPTGTSVADVARRRFPEAAIVESGDPTRDLEEGRVAAAVQDAVTRVFLDQHSGVRPLREADGRLLVISREYGHPAVRPDDPRFLNWLNNWIHYHRAQGDLERLCDLPLRASLAS